VKDLILDALLDSAGMAPFLFIIYILLALLEHRLGSVATHHLHRSRIAGPLLGALSGCVPQCGFSVVASALYSRRLITVGTLLAVYLATSDEAIPVILAQPDRAGIVVKLLVTKVGIGLLFGYGTDLILGSYRRKEGTDGSLPDDVSQLDCCERINVTGCCNHDVVGSREKWRWLRHALIHTARILAFIFVITLGINCLVWFVGEDNLGNVLLRRSLLQPVLSSLVGLIPNCAASVAVTEAYLRDGLTFGAAIAGLCSSAGLGIPVLFRENRDKRDTIRILLLLLTISASVGVIIQLVYG
jgi:hypothetical protein